MVHVRKINTLYGLKYAVVDLFTHYPTKLNRFNKPETVKVTEYLTLDYKRGNESFPAIFNLTTEGLKDAKEVQKLFKNKG